MGLFSSKSSSTSKTEYNDNSTNLSVDLSSGDLGSSPSKNIVAGGSVNLDGLSDDLAKTIFSYTDSSYQNSASILGKSIENVANSYKNATSFVERAIGNNDTKTQNTLDLVTTSLQSAYNSEASTISSIKTFALYGLIGFVAYSYLTRK